MATKQQSKISKGVLLDLHRRMVRIRLLEEAAGITGLHSRRHEAELRLNATETNLERVKDLLKAQEEQLEVLKKL